MLTTSIHPGWARTPLIAPVEQELRRRGTTIIEPSDVADAVVDGIFSCRGGQVFLPAGMGKSTLLRGLPNWLQEKTRDDFSKTLLDSIKLKN